ncbi:MAG: glutathionylspermidine synthase family protein [Phycisphaerae bacterium]|nr:glutathionylspermidine synthase family protein [Phycisphaerae bacterium]
MTRTQTFDVRAGARWPDALDRARRSRLVFEFGKCDPQYGDVDVTARWPLELSARTWSTLTRAAESLDAESLAMEAELCRRRDLWPTLGIPRRVAAALARVERIARTPRFSRYDFHPSLDGWALSEVNADVPGGFLEAHALSTFALEDDRQARSPGDPGAAVADAVVAACVTDAPVGLVHATAYTDDRQVVAFLGRRLEGRGRATVLLAPDHVRWIDGVAHADIAAHRGPLAALVRFYPAEWLPALSPWPFGTPRWAGFASGVGAGETPQANPATALLMQSKRVPLVWATLAAGAATANATWRAWLPETVEPSRVLTRRGLPDDWCLKPALGRVGDGIVLDGVTPERERRRLLRSARWFPKHWVAQRRFRSRPIESPDGPVHACVGVYVVDGRACGAYARVAAKPLIDANARDVGVVVIPDDGPAATTSVGPHGLIEGEARAYATGRL